MRRWLLVPVIPAAALALRSLAAAAPDPAQTTADDVAAGQVLFADRCASCHGLDGAGVAERGPDIRHEGAASADFVLRTGRMPMADPGMQTERGPVRFDETEITQLVAFVSSLGEGPEIPVVDLDGADIANGGEQYRLNCAACHVASGAGTAIGGASRAPSLMNSTPTEVAEAIIVGPGVMPVFGGFTESDINDVAAYVELLRTEHSTSPEALGGVGPVAEGLAAWLLGLLPIVALTRWIGRPTERRDAGAHPDEEATA